MRFGDDSSLSATENGEMLYGRHNTSEPCCVVRSCEKGRVLSGSMSSLRQILDRKSYAYPCDCQRLRHNATAQGRPGRYLVFVSLIEKWSERYKFL